MRKFDVSLSRIAVTGSILVTCAIAAYNPYGPTRTSFEEPGQWDTWGGLLSVVLMGLLALIAMFDTIINDLLPDKYHFHLPLKVRHLLFFLLAGSQLGLIYNNVISNNYDVLLLKYAWDGVISVAVVFADFAARHHRLTMKGIE